MEQSPCLFAPGTLWPTWLERTASAQRGGAIESIKTRPETIQQNGVTFQVRIITSLAKKVLAAATQQDTNPFLPYDPHLFVTNVTKTHVALLNKFNVVEHHLLLVTRTFEPQESLLTFNDCEALCFCLSEIDGLGFYNGGTIAGASQPHKHLQLIPVSELANNGLPITPLLQSAKMRNHVGTIPGFPFLHAYTPLPSTLFQHKTDGGQELLNRYYSLLDAVGLLSSSHPAGEWSPAYNLLVTRDWMLLVPRSHECFKGISLNALAFAGAFLVRDASQFAVLKEHGPLRALQDVGWPKDSAKRKT